MIFGIYEYCGIQRCGKSTKMVFDLLTQASKFYGPDDVWANFTVKVDGVHVLETEDLIQRVFDMKRKGEVKKVILFDECGQFLIARDYRNKEQGDFVRFAWQMPKRGILFQYGSNMGNSADVILRDATWQTIMPRYFHGKVRAEDFIVSRIICNYDMRYVDGVVMPRPDIVQRYFNSREPIE